MQVYGVHYLGEIKENFTTISV